MPINEAMKGDPKFFGLGKMIPVRAVLEIILCLLKQVANRSTHVRELCSTTIDYGGYCGARGTSIGGTIIPLDSPVEETVFRFELPQNIQKRFQA
jgi:hypothetical protein